MSDTIPLPRAHYDYVELEEPPICQCRLCVEYRAAVTPYVAAVKETEEHNFRCRCVSCKNRRKLESEQLAADNRRTLWCEGCWTAVNKPWGPLFLDWLEDKILNDGWAVKAKGKTTNYWWVHEGERRSIDWWLEEWIDETGFSDTMVTAHNIMRDPAMVTKVLQQPTERVG